jgi:hypothetical protein
MCGRYALTSAAEQLAPKRTQVRANAGNRP